MKNKKVWLVAIVVLVVLAMVSIGVYTGYVTQMTEDNHCVRSPPPSVVSEYQNTYKDRFYDNVKKTCFAQDGIYYCKYTAQNNMADYGWYTKSNNKCVGNDVYICEDDSGAFVWRKSQTCDGFCSEGQCKPDPNKLCRDRGYLGVCRLNGKIQISAEVQGQIDAYGKDKFLSQSLIGCVDQRGQNLCQYGYDANGSSYGWYLYRENKCGNVSLAQENAAYECKEVEKDISCWVKKENCENQCLDGSCINSNKQCHELDFNFDGVINESDVDVLKTVASVCTDVNGDGYIDNKDELILNQFINKKCEFMQMSCTDADLDGDGFVGNSDLLIFNDAFNKNKCMACTDCSADLNKDGFVNQLDYYIINSHLNEVCEPIVFDATS